MHQHFVVFLAQRKKVEVEVQLDYLTLVRRFELLLVLHQH
jgi:hypothetical protein